MFMVMLGYPKAHELKEIIRKTTVGELPVPNAVLTGEEVVHLRQMVWTIPISDHVLDYIVRLVQATHPGEEGTPEFSSRYLSWGAGPRAGQYLSLGAKSRALLRGNLQATADDVRAVIHPLITNYTALADGVSSDDVIDQLLKAVPETSR
jgi:MoxR-like ATPase